MRVLSILPFSPPARSVGGAERQMHSLHQGLVARGVQVDVLADIEAVGQVRQVIDHVTVWGVRFPILTSHPLRPGNAKLWRDWMALRHFVQSSLPRPDLIQVTTFRQPALVGHLLAGVLQVPWVARLACSGSHGDFRFCDGNWLSRWQLPSLVKSVSAVVALDTQTRQEALDRGVPESRVVIIRNGLVFKRPPLHVRSATGLNAPPLRVLFLGRLAAQKRLPTLIHAWQQAMETASALELQLAGDGEERGALEALVASLGIASNVKFLGRLDDPQTALEQAQLFVNPSESEGLPNAVLEAAACGVPLILSDIPIHREIAEAVGMIDYLFAVGDAPALAVAIQRFIGLHPAAREQLSQRCAAFGQRFLPQNRDSAYLHLYRKLLESRNC